MKARGNASAAAKAQRGGSATTTAGVAERARRPLGRQIAASDDRRGVGPAAFLLAILTTGALAHVAVRLKSLDVAYALGRERRVAADLEEQRRGLQIEIGMLKDPGRVVTIARDKLKMGPPAAEAIRALVRGRPLDTAGPSGPIAATVTATPAVPSARASKPPPGPPRAGSTR